MKSSTLCDETKRGVLSNGCDSSANHEDLRREIARLKVACEQARSENVIYSHVAHALAQGCVDLFYVNMDTDEYVEYYADDGRSSLAEKRRAADFFESCKREVKQCVHLEDQAAFVAAMNREFLTEALNRSKAFEMSYRRIKDGKQFYVNMRVTRMKDDGRFIVIAVTDIDELVKQRFAEERMQEERLERVRSLANVDALTSVKNKHAYLEVEARMDRHIAKQDVSPFAIVMLDVNDLKKVNDTAGHQAGDELLQDACKAICDIFKHSPVFRVGGDEFTVIAQGEDYERLEERLEMMRDRNKEALRSGGAVIACGMAKFEDDTCVATVFERADRNMYKDKNRLKSYGKLRLRKRLKPRAKS